MNRWKSGSVYLTSKDKEMIDELIEMYFVAITPDEETAEQIHRIRAKIGGYNSHRRKMKRRSQGE
ncbi:hypothetical protein MOE00_04705 [Bacillus inaquosorum]|uniref:Uncharacterized protein n=1 Tax=Bacillus inaquosorum TaxID=483913 RepID=A0A9Q4ERR2_9BACI|nr:hypothetical protein [Bacillus inaquosorum]MCY7789301.1 hypothetical protein [Bacillus inaquosorum]MCY7819844.1 hypothetical protein [Bacillus inaquosorum]MCY7939923.1 hypothetical protein [Bacillus inaquosorum]MCY7943745.1 hypothetical protein [Bacillus inaquosorum]MCY7984356.1 hypothetical protein [Bacillus inaquosorum]